MEFYVIPYSIADTTGDAVSTAPSASAFYTVSFIQFLSLCLSFARTFCPHSSDNVIVYFSFRHQSKENLIISSADKKLY